MGKIYHAINGKTHYKLPFLEGKNRWIPSGVIKHGWLENPHFEWRIIDKKNTDFYGPFSSTPCLISGGYAYHCVLHDDLPSKKSQLRKAIVNSCKFWKLPSIPNGHFYHSYLGELE